MTTEVVERKYAEMSVDDLKTRATELRFDFASMHDGERTDEYSESVRGILREITMLDNQLTLARAQEYREEQRDVAPSAATAELMSGVRSIGDRIMDNDAMKAWVEGGMRGGADSVIDYYVDGSIDAGLRAIINEFGSGGPGNNATNGVSGLLPVGQPIPPTPRQGRLFMRDLLPVQATTLTQVPYVRELNPVSLEGGASAVSEGSVKPDVALSLSSATAYVTVIAGNISPTKQLWEDAPLVVAYINQRLPYLVKLREDYEILQGSGTYPDIQGIKNVSGIQSQGATSGEYAITLGNAIAKVENVDGSATAVVMNPTDAWSMFVKRASGGSGTFDAGTPFAGGGFSTVWGLPIMRSRVYAQGNALVGDFQRGGMILDREQVNVQVYPQHSDYAARNAVLVQAEERVGCMWFRPDYFVSTTLS